MKEEKKTHYRAIAKSDHLGVADLEDYIEGGNNLIFTINKVMQHQSIKVAGKNIAANIAYFKESWVKPLVLNATNAKIIKGFANSPFVEDWSNISIQLYIDENVKMKGEVVGGVRIRPMRPKLKTKISFTSANFEKAAAAKATKEMIEKNYTLTDKIWNEYVEYTSK